MKINSKDIMDEFFESIRKDYPGVTQDQVKEIAHGPWKSLSHIMASGSLESFRMKYFGVFRVLKSRCKFMLINMERKHKAGNLDLVEFENYKAMINKYLENGKD